MKLNAHLDFKLLLGKLAKNAALGFLALLFLILAYEVLEIKTSVGVVLNAGREPALVSHEKGVRINFEAYNQVVKRIEGANSFRPQSFVTANPFQ